LAEAIHPFGESPGTASATDLTELVVPPTAPAYEQSDRDDSPNESADASFSFQNSTACWHRNRASNISQDLTGAPRPGNNADAAFNFFAA
jgi:hypothetical protein